MADEKTVTIDGTEYLLKDLSADSQAVVESLRFVEGEIATTQARLAVLSTAKAAYIGSLKNDPKLTSGE